MRSQEFRFEDGVLYGGQDIKGFTGLVPPAVGGKRQFRVVGGKRRAKQVGMDESLEEGKKDGRTRQQKWLPPNNGTRRKYREGSQANPSPPLHTHTLD